MGAATRLRVAVFAAALVGALLMSSTGALAATGHKFLSQLEAPTPPGLSEPAGIAVDQKTGQVFVADETNGVGIEIFSAAGKFETHLVTQALSGTGAATRVAVDEATGFVYAIATGGGEGDELDVFKPLEGTEYELVAQWSGAATVAGHFASLTGVAVDNSKGASAHDVYVIDEGIVETFEPQPAGPKEGKEGTRVTRNFAGLEQPTAIAVNATEGDVYIGDSGKGSVNVYAPTGGAAVLKMKGKGSPTGGGLGPEAGSPETEISGIAVNPAGEVFVAAPEVGVVDQLNAAGEWIGWMTSGAGGVPFSLPVAVGLAPSGDIYVSDFGRPAVDVFSTGSTGPFVRTKEPKTIERLSATLAGQITPHGASETSYYFEWGTATEAGYSHKTEVVNAGTAEVKVNVTAEITGLAVGSSYKYRLVGEEEGVPFDGQNEEFETIPAVEGVTTQALPVSGVTASEATLNGSLISGDPGLGSTGVFYYFQYGETTGYGSTSPAPPGTNVGLADEVVPATTTLKGLNPNAVYHYRLVATNSFGTTFGEDAVLITHGPPRITPEAAVSGGATGETLKAKLNPDGEETKYFFEYGETPPTGSGTRTPEETLPAGASKTVEAKITGLKLGTTYHYRLVAFHESEKASPVTSPDATFTTSLIESESASHVSESGATIESLLNPNGADVKYHFEYGATASYGTTVPIPDGDLGAGEPEKTVSEVLTGLTPSTTYHFRIVAKVGAETATGGDRTFTTNSAEPPPPLADARAYELVSPPEKHGALLDGIARTWGLTQSAVDGSALTYPSDGAITESAEGNREPEPSQNLATRGSGGWATQDLATPHERAAGLFQSFAEYREFSPNLSLSVVEPNPFGKTALAEPPLSPPAQPGEVQEKTIYERANTPLAPGSGEAAVYKQAQESGEKLSQERHSTLPGYLALLTAANTAPGTKIGGHLPPQGEFEKPPFNNGHEFVTATPDLSHAILRSLIVPFTTESTEPGLYEWANGQIKLVNILPDGKPAPEIVSPRIGQGSANVGENLRHALSEDGNRVVWSTSPEHNEKADELFLRDMGKGKTVRLDEVQGGPPLPEGATGEAQFQVASKNDSRVFFTDSQRLTSDSKALTNQPDLYMCEIGESAGAPTCKLKDLTPAGAGEAAQVRGLVLGASEEGTVVYLVAGGVLSTGANGHGEKAQPLANNLYMLRESAGTWSTTFIAQLGGEDRNDFTNRSVNKPNAVSELTARVSPNGEWLAFMSNRQLTGQDNTDATSGAADQEVFLFGGGNLVCASCNPNGSRPHGVLDKELTSEGSGLLVDRALTWAGQTLAGNIPTSNPDNEFVTQHQPRYLSDKGRLFFNSPSDLVPAAKNGKENVYELEQKGEGSCASASGCIAMLSSGTSTHESAFLDASETGDSAFLITASPLTPRDTDESFDIYDARVCTTESPCLDQSVPPPPVRCESLESCRPISPEGVTVAAPATTTTGASGNLNPGASVIGPKPPAPPAKPKALTNKQKLAKALTVCRKKHNKHKRQACEKQARKKYPVKKAAKKASKATKKGTRP